MFPRDLTLQAFRALSFKGLGLERERERETKRDRKRETEVDRERERALGFQGEGLLSLGRKAPGLV